MWCQLPSGSRLTIRGNASKSEVATELHSRASCLLVLDQTLILIVCSFSRASSFLDLLSERGGGGGEAQEIYFVNTISFQPSLDYLVSRKALLRPL